MATLQVENGCVGELAQSLEQSCPITCPLQMSFDHVLQLVVTKSLMVVLTCRKSKDLHSGVKRKRQQEEVDKEDISCIKILQTIFLRCFRSSLPLEDEDIAQLLCQLHPHILESLYQTQSQEMGLIIALHPSQWPSALHKLFVFHISYRLASMPGNEALWQSLRDPQEKFKRIEEVTMRYVNHMDMNKSMKSRFFALTPKPKTIGLDRFHNVAIGCLRNIDWYATNVNEERNLDILGITLERFVPEEFPLDILLLLDREDWKERFDIWKKLRAARMRNHLGEWRSVISALPDRFKRYVKFLLLTLTRQEQFSATYVIPSECRLTKCTRNMEEDENGDGRSSPKTTVTFCNFCKECLTYVDMGRRPPSFGHYLNVDTMKQFCHRDDSDRLCLISCLRDEPYVNIEFGHPDRETFGVCQGRRACFELVGYPDRLCAYCFHDTLTELDMHTGTCLIPREDESEEMCSGCQHLFSKDPAVKERLISQREAEMRQKQEEQIALEVKVEEDKNGRWQTQKRKLLYLMDVAMKRKQRNKLVK